LATKHFGLPMWGCIPESGSVCYPSKAGYKPLPVSSEIPETMNHVTHNAIANFIWNIADDVLRDVYVRGKYRDVILPMTVIRRLDCLLEPTKAKILERHKFLEENKIHNQAPQLAKVSGYPFYNTSRFTLRRLLDEPSQIRANFENYLNGFSDNVQEIITKFKFRNQLETLEESNRLYGLIEKFLSP